MFKVKATYSQCTVCNCPTILCVHIYMCVIYFVYLFSLTSSLSFTIQKSNSWNLTHCPTHFRDKWPMLGQHDSLPNLEWAGQQRTFSTRAYVNRCIRTTMSLYNLKYWSLIMPIIEKLVTCLTYGYRLPHSQLPRITWLKTLANSQWPCGFGMNLRTNSPVFFYLTKLVDDVFGNLLWTLKLQICINFVCLFCRMLMFLSCP